MPTLNAAKAALELVEKKALEFLKALPNPPAMVAMVLKCVAYFKPNGNDNAEAGWAGAKQMLNKPGEFLDRLKNYGSNIAKVKEATIQKIQKEINDNLSDEEKVKATSKDAYGMLIWVKNTLKLYDVYKEVDPLKKKVAEMS